MYSHTIIINSSTEAKCRRIRSLSSSSDRMFEQENVKDAGQIKASHAQTWVNYQLDNGIYLFEYHDGTRRIVEYIEINNGQAKELSVDEVKQHFLDLGQQVKEISQRRRITEMM